jgi:Tfp pilus assembly protein PilN
MITITLVTLVLLQSLPMDPRQYPASWGVLGALVLVIMVLLAVVYAVFVRGRSDAQQQTNMFMEFVSSHTDKHMAALGTLGNQIRSGDERIALALEMNAKGQRAILVAWEALARSRAQKAGGGALTPVEIDQILRSSYDVVNRTIG